MIKKYTIFVYEKTENCNSSCDKIKLSWEEFFTGYIV